MVIVLENSFYKALGACSDRCSNVIVVFQGASCIEYFLQFNKVL